MGEKREGNQSPDTQHDQHVSSVSVRFRTGKNCDIGIETSGGSLRKTDFVAR